MINSLFLKNFKSFKEQTVKFKPLTLLAGINSSGKSSVIQAIRLCSPKNMGFSVLKEYGGYADLRCVYADTNQEIQIRVNFSENEYASLKTGEDGKTILREGQLPPERYIAADRLGPQVFYISQTQGDKTVGNRGENIILYCMQHQDNLVDEIRRHPLSDGESFEYNIEAWMNEISPGVRLEFVYDRQIDVGSVRIGQKGDLTISQRATNVGFGLSYTLPVVAALLGAQKNDLLLIENPEAHLHPIGQTKIGELLARTAQCGVQVVVETHSDHLIDGARIAVQDKILSPENGIVLFFSKSEKTHLSQVEEISFSDNGELSHWPEGFCDQSLKNLSRLATF